MRGIPSVTLCALHDQLCSDLTGEFTWQLFVECEIPGEGWVSAVVRVWIGSSVIYVKVDTHSILCPCRGCFRPYIWTGSRKQRGGNGKVNVFSWNINPEVYKKKTIYVYYVDGRSQSLRIFGIGKEDGKRIIGKLGYTLLLSTDGGDIRLGPQRVCFRCWGKTCRSVSPSAPGRYIWTGSRNQCVGIWWVSVWSWHHRYTVDIQNNP